MIGRVKKENVNPEDSQLIGIFRKLFANIVKNFDLPRENAKLGTLLKHY